MNDQGHFPITEGLQLCAEIDQGCVKIQQPSHLTRLCGDIRAIKMQACFDNRLINLRGNILQISVCHPLIKDEHRRNISAQSARADRGDGRGHREAR